MLHRTARISVALSAIVASLVVRTAHAQCTPDWAAGFEGRGTSGASIAVVEFDDGSGPALYFGGLFQQAGGAPAAYMARWDGVGWEALGSGMNNLVKALVVYDDGTGPALYAGGWFTLAGGVPAAGIARWNGSSWSDVGGGVAGSIDALRVLDLGAGPELLAGGGCTSAGGAPAEGLARWNGTSWSDFGTSGTFIALDMAVFDDGTGPALYVGGAFNSTGTVVANNIARWDGTTWWPVAGGTSSTIYALQVASLGGTPALYAGGRFTSAGGAPASGIARYDAAGWSALSTGVAGPSTPVVSTLASWDDGSGPALFAGGAFDQAGGIQVSSIARWNGAAWSAVGAATTNAYEDVEALLVSDAGQGPALYTAGAFASFAGIGTRSVARWDGSEWSALDEGAGLSGDALALAVHDDGTGLGLFVAGNFGSAGAIPASEIARWSGSGWSALGSGVSGTPLSMASFDDGLGAGNQLYVAGNLTSAGGVPCSRIARWNGASWSAVSTGLPGIGHALCVFDDGTGPALYAGGESGSTGFVRRWNGTAWSTVGTGFNSVVFGLAAHDDGSGGALYAGGLFTSAGGVAVSKVARWNGTSWSPVGGGGPTDFRVTCFATWDDGAGAKLYAGGRFSQIDGVPAARIARWDGSSWSALGAGVDSGVVALAAHEDGTGSALYAAGAFTNAGGVPAARIARWNGTAWSSLGDGLGGDAAALAVFADGQPDEPALFVGGSFASAGGRSSFGLAKWSACGAPGAVFCTGDDLDPLVTMGCPCANAGAPGHGCANSVASAGAVLGVRGATNPDTVKLLASGMPATVTAIYLKGDAKAVHGLVFGDGVRCVDGALIRLSTVHNVGGASEYPIGAQASVSVRGATPPGSGLVARYQVYYRNAAASFCPPATFNVSNGYRIVW